MLAPACVCDTRCGFVPVAETTYTSLLVSVSPITSFIVVVNAICLLSEDQAGSPPQL